MTTNNETVYKVKSNGREIYTTPDALKAHKFALDLADRTDEAVTVYPNPMGDLREFAQNFPVNFRLAAGYTSAKLPSYLLPFVDVLESEFREWENKSLQAG